MRPLCLALALLFCCGCFSDGAKEAWEPFFKDLRGDNMKMSTDRATPR